MKKRGSFGKTDPIEREIEHALRPGSFIRDGASFSFVTGLDQVATTIEKLIAAEASRAVMLYEVYLPECKLAEREHPFVVESEPRDEEGHRHPNTAQPASPVDMAPTEAREGGESRRNRKP